MASGTLSLRPTGLRRALESARVALAVRAARRVVAARRAAVRSRTLRPAGVMRTAALRLIGAKRLVAAGAFGLRLCERRAGAAAASAQRQAARVAPWRGAAARGFLQRQRGHGVSDSGGDD